MFIYELIGPYAILDSCYVSVKAGITIHYIFRKSPANKISRHKINGLNTTNSMLVTINFVKAKSTIKLKKGS